jgi:hypothetical protein|tara:strand:- start:46639 stop:46851 length:213 start_codon:yes stop_codon:yes gene_type:complete
MDPARELPYWPAAMALHIEARQMTASDYVPNRPKNRLHLKGRPQMLFRAKPSKEDVALTMSGSLPLVPQS